MKFLVRILNRLNLLKYFNLTIKTTVNQKDFNIPIIGGIGLNNFRISEPWMTKILETIIAKKNDGAYLDVGVNIGQTLIKLKSVNKKVKYFGFEPNPVCFFYVQKLINSNNFSDTTIFPCGISNSSSLRELAFFSDSDTDSGASLIHNFRPTDKIYKKEFISCYNVAEIFLKGILPNISIIKIDVEGGELEVLEGLEKIIEINEPYIQIEILPVYDKSNIERLTRQNKIEEFLKRMDYIIFRIHYDDTNEFNSIKLLDTIGIHSNVEWSEYLLVPKKEKQRIQTAF